MFPHKQEKYVWGGQKTSYRALPFYSVRQKHRNKHTALKTQTHTARHTHISGSDKNKKENLTLLIQYFCRRIHRSGRPDFFFFFNLTASQSFLSLLLLLSTFVPLLSRQPNYTWLLFSRSIHSSSSVLALLSLFSSFALPLFSIYLRWNLPATDSSHFTL